jgi:hypothetical protein
VSNILGVPKDTAAGVLFMVVGAGALAIGADYRTGTLLHMGPGYFPRMMNALLLFLGAVVAILGLRHRRAASEPEPPWSWRAMVAVLGGIVLFGFGLERFGLVASIAALTLVSAYAERKRGAIEALVRAVSMNVIAWLVFVLGLGMPLPLWPDAGGS